MALCVAQAEIGSLVQAQEADRARIARELHDGVGQKLALLQVDLDQIARTLPSLEHQAQIQGLSGQVADIARELHNVRQTFTLCSWSSSDWRSRSRPSAAKVRVSAERR